MEPNSDSTLSNKNRMIANILLILVTVLWGTSFILTKNLTQEVPIFLYLGIRFSIAIIGFIPYFVRIKRLNKKILLYGTVTGLMYYFTMVFQTLLRRYLLERMHMLKYTEYKIKIYTAAKFQCFMFIKRQTALLHQTPLL